MVKAVIVTGTPGTGKTLIAKRLSKLFNLKYVDVSSLIKKNRLFDGFDRKFKTKLVDVKRLNRFLINLIKKSKETLVIDSHLSHYLPKKYVKLGIITKCNLKVLKDRLKMRRYNKRKIDENMEAEILRTCYVEAVERRHKIIEIDTSEIRKINKELNKIRIK